MKKSLILILALLWIIAVGFGATKLTKTNSSLAVKEGTFKVFKAHNGLQIEYAVLVPENYKPQNIYQGVMMFASNDTDKSKVTSLLDQVWKNTALKNEIIFLPLAPTENKRGWITHPAHHALEDFMKYLKKEYQIKGGQFHCIGIQDGAIPSQVYMDMSRPFFNRITLASSHFWEHYKAENYDEFKKANIPVTLLFGGKDEKGMKYAKRVKFELKNRSVDLQFHILPDDGAELNSLTGEMLLRPKIAFIH